MRSIEKNGMPFVQLKLELAFWHTSDRLDHALAVGGKDAQNASFFLMQRNKIVAIAPLVVTVNNLGLRVANYAGWGTPVPVISGQLSNSKRKKINKEIFKEIESITRDLEIDFVLLQFLFKSY